ncbi:hypothetical protein HCA44_11110 [Rhodococcus sp. HNM0569]|nr:hypothetical protein [Rhodococcus sp. HNM0569]
MTLGNGLLPVDVWIDDALHHWVAPTHVASAVMDGYRTALRVAKGKRFEDNHFRVLAPVPARRAVLSTLLRTSTALEYRRVRDSVTGGARFVASGDARTRGDAPAVTVSADRFVVTRVAIDPEWVATVPAREIEHELVSCARALGASRPVFVEHAEHADWTDNQLETTVAAHHRALLRAR